MTGCLMSDRVWLVLIFVSFTLCAKVELRVATHVCDSHLGDHLGK